MINIKPKIYFESLTTSRIKEHVKGRNILVVCSNSVWNLSSISKVITSLQNQHKIKIFTHISQNAPISEIQKIIDECSGLTPETIIGVGGGSVIDACKALSVCFGQINIYDLFYGKAPLPSKKVSLIAIPTTAGTGAELSFGAILYDDINIVKGGIRGEVLQPDVVIIDVDLYKTAPNKIKAEVGFDSLTHAIETYLSNKASALTRYQSIAAIKTIFNSLPDAVGGNINALGKMAIASSMMGINLAYSSTCLPHRIQYIIGPLTNTSHAQGLIALYNGWIKLISENKRLSGLKNLESDMGKNFNLVDQIERLKEKLNLNHSISSLGIKEDDWGFIADNVNGALNSDPSYKDKNTIRYILKHSN